MNKIKLLGRLQEFFNAGEKEKREKADEIREIIKKLRNKLRKTVRRLDQCHDEEMKKVLQLEADIIKAQIDKGIDVLKHL